MRDRATAVVTLDLAVADLLALYIVFFFLVFSLLVLLSNITPWSVGAAVAAAATVALCYAAGPGGGYRRLAYVSMLAAVALATMSQAGGWLGVAIAPAVASAATAMYYIKTIECDVGVGVGCGRGVRALAAAAVAAGLSGLAMVASGYYVAAGGFDAVLSLMVYFVAIIVLIAAVGALYMYRSGLEQHLLRAALTGVVLYGLFLGLLSLSVFAGLLAVQQYKFMYLGGIAVYGFAVGQLIGDALSLAASADNTPCTYTCPSKLAARRRTKEN